MLLRAGQPMQMLQPAYVRARHKMNIMYALHNETPVAAIHFHALQTVMAIRTQAQHLRGRATTLPLRALIVLAIRLQVLRPEAAAHRTHLLLQEAVVVHRVEVVAEQGREAETNS
jgi:hypothetical protein